MNAMKLERKKEKENGVAVVVYFCKFGTKLGTFNKKYRI